MKLTELFLNIADTIRSSHYDTVSPIKATDFPTKISEACDNREMVGWESGKNQGYNEGVQAEYDRFWDTYQQNGTRTSYPNAFYNWNADIYEPKYPIVMAANASCTNTFSWMTGLTDTKVDIILNNNCDVRYMFNYCSKLETVRKIVCVPTAKFDGTGFYNCSALKNITFEGEIGTNMNFQYSPLLTTASLLSILTALSKDSSYASGKTLTLNSASKAVIEADSECSKQLDSAVSAGWTVTYV